MDHLDRVREHFDSCVEAWDQHYRREPPTPRDATLRGRRDLALNFLHERVRSPGRIFEAGPGPGALALGASLMGYRVEGMDLSPGMAERARENAARYGVQPIFGSGDVFSTPHEWGRYDAVVALDVLQYQPNPSRALMVMARLLKRGGILILSVPNRIRVSNCFGRWDLARDLCRLARRKLRGETVPEPLDLQKFNTERIHRLLGTVGLILLDYRRHGYSGNACGILNAQQEFALGHFIESLPNLLPLIPNNRFADEIVTVSRTYREGEAG